MSRLRPEEIALGDRVLQVLALVWVATLTLAVYVRVTATRGASPGCVARTVTCASA